MNNIDLIDFNKFIIRHLLIRVTNKENLVQWVIIISILLFSIHFQNTDYIFIPQSNLTTFGLFLVLNFAMTAVVMAFYPIVLILMVNYLTNKLKFRYHSLIIPKIIFLGCLFYLCIQQIASSYTSLQNKLHVTLIWVGLYFLFVNLYFNFLAHGSLVITKKARLIYVIIFTILLIKPASFLFEHTSEMLNNININPHMYLDANSCKLIATDTEILTNPNNLIFNNPKYYQQTDHGCFIYKNTIRFGFASDFTLLIKKNINPLNGADGLLHNEWVRLNCFSSVNMCFSEDNLITDAKNDKYDMMIKNQAMLLHPIK